MEYSEFILSDKEKQNKEMTMNNQNTIRQNMIKDFVTNNGLTKLKSMYFGMDSYYYDYKKHTMYKVHNVCGWNGDATPTFEVCNDRNILEYNGLN
jgi:hypothetical protein